MSAFKIDGNFNLAEACGAARKVYPFAGDQSSYYMEQDFMQFLSKWAPLPLNTLYPNSRNLYLVEETPVTPLGEDVCRWTRTYSIVPVIRDEWETFNYEYPGYDIGNGTTTAGNVDGRLIQILTVPSKLRYDYFLTGAPSQYLNQKAIPINRAYKVYGASGPAFPLKTLGLITTPSKDTYISMIRGGVEIIAEDSISRRWKGNIFERVTRYVPAK